VRTALQECGRLASPARLSVTHLRWIHSSEASAIPDREKPAPLELCRTALAAFAFVCGESVGWLRLGDGTATADFFSDLPTDGGTRFSSDTQRRDQQTAATELALGVVLALPALAGFPSFPG
jgi:hypothetical protein